MEVALHYTAKTLFTLFTLSNALQYLDSSMYAYIY